MAGAWASVQTGAESKTDHQDQEQVKQDNGQGTGFAPVLVNNIILIITN